MKNILDLHVRTVLLEEVIIIEHFRDTRVKTEEVYYKLVFVK